MTIPTNWPNPERPGVPMFPDRNGLHAIRTPLGTEFLVKWDSAGARLLNLSGSPVPVERHPKLSYIGPCLTPAQIAEMLAAERERCAKVCEDEYEKSGKDFEYGGYISCAEEIRNLGDAP
ncbi:hypothetical protein [Acetobacter lambici]|uniref:Uncharacterized protein n=1 Tax=Acetobacter lambici TaxID=1332824 RepID=A0ABT1EZI5_9PROT|nr:hypothetical protein [Acetobacter lambici]MCP1243277.1 hypothetical protein [Acetobacter lambici]MCP1258350.1 hypothetical protein [Acetobacter lambici]